ncbi:MAG: hypothetical protein U0X91_21425 [Spirosomataceae bacterium]
MKLIIKTMALVLAMGISSKAQEEIQPPKDGKMELPTEATTKTLAVSYKDGKLAEVQRLSRIPENDRHTIEILGDIKLKRTSKGAVLSATGIMLFVPFQSGKVLNLGKRVAWECNCTGCSWPVCTGGECCYPTLSNEYSTYKIGSGGGIIIIADDVADVKNSVAKAGGGIIITPDDVNLKNSAGKIVAKIAGGGGGITVIIDNF